MRPSARFCSVVAVVGVVAAAAPAVAKETVVDDFEAADSPMPWVFSNGSEFPGATGSFTSGTGHTGKGGILEYDLTKGGHYVSASLTLGTPITAAAIAYWAKVPAGIHATLRVTDSSGQTLQYTVSRPLEAFDANAWFREVVALDAPSSHFGGPDDGVVHQPVKAVSLLAADPPEPSAGRIAFDDVVAIDVLAPRIDPRAPATSPAPAGAADLASRLGVNVHFTKDDTALDLAQQAGFTVVRQDLGWSGVEHTKGSYDFSALDTLVASLATRGMKLLLILDYMNSLYPGADSADFATATIPAFAALSKAAAQHFKGKNVLFEVWNEPNLDGFWPPHADASQYGALAKAAIAAVHQGDAAAKVSTAGISQFDFAFLRGYLAQGGATGADAIGVHPYRQNGPESVGDDLVAMRAIVGSAASSTPPIWATEWGYSSTWYGDGHAAENQSKQGDYAVREVLSAWAVGFPLLVYYDVRDDGTDATNAENNFGLLNDDYSPKPAYTAMKTLSQFVKSRSFSGFIATTPSSLHAMQLTSSDRAGAVVWSDAPGGSVTVTVPAGTQATGMLGDSVAVTTQGTDAVLTVSEPRGPVYLSLAAAAGGSSASGGAGNAGVAGASGDGGNGGDGGANAGGDRGSMASAGAGGAGNAGSTGTGAATSRAGATGTGATSGTGRAGSSGTGGDGSGPGGGFDTGGSSTNGADAGTGSADDSASCGCSLPHTSDSRATWTVAALGALVLRRRRAASRPQRR
jgi:MYXO-CTERM domain-containing protein